LHDLPLLGAFAILKAGLSEGLWIWFATLLLPAWRGRKRRPSSGASRARLPVTFTFALIVALAGVSGWTATHTLGPSLNSDGPAHQAAIQDARTADTWLPPDRSVDAESTAVDPRFGVGHGLYAAVAQATALTPAQVLRHAPTVLAPLWLLAHAWLFLEFGLASAAALLAAVLFTFASGGERGFGLWSSAYPGNLALALATLGVAACLGSYLQPQRERPSWTGVSHWAGPAVVGLTVLIHPFAWWAWTLALFHAAVLLLSRRDRGLARALFAVATGCLALGVLLILPRWIERASSGGGAHYQVTDALFLSDRLFVVDPLVLLSWATATTLWVVPVGLLVLDHGRRSPRAVVAWGAALTVWTISFNPLLEPWVWKVTAYLSVRLGRLTYAPALWLLVLGLAWSAFQQRRRLAFRLLALLPLMASGWLLVREAQTAVAALQLGSRLQRAEHREQRLWSNLQELSASLDSLPPGRVIADPRTSYGLRAVRGGPVVLTPLAHASPHDTENPRRLRTYRELLDPFAPLDSFQVGLARLEGDYLVVNERVESFYRWQEYGFVPSDGAQAALASRLQAAGVAPVAHPLGWSVYRVPELLGIHEVEWEPPAPGPPLDGDDALARPIRGREFEVVGLRALEAEGAAGGTLPFRVWYAPVSEAPGRDVVTWERLFLRLEGPMEPVPEWARPAGKLYRKLVVEQSGRSASRFGRGWFPFDGMRPSRRWGDGVVSEVRMIPIPPHVTPGPYTLQLTVHDTPWRGNRTLRDYLSNEDSFSGEVLGSVVIHNGAETN
jgi:hypothetical protein